MKSHKREIVLVSAIIAFCFSLTSIVLGIDQYRDLKEKINFEYDESVWRVQANQSKHLSLINKHHQATVSIHVYPYTDTITVNGFYVARQTAKFDGWINLKHRKGEEFENKRANAEESFITVNTKHKLDDNLNITKIITGEYYFLKDNTIYVISLTSNREIWKEIGTGFKGVVGSFWLGTERRSVEDLGVRAQDNSWKSLWKNNSNHIRASDSIVPITGYRDQKWEKALISNIESNQKGIVINDTLYFQSEKSIVATSLIDGALKWQLSLEAKIERSLIYQEDILYFIYRKKKKSYLVGILAENGSKLFEVSLKGKKQAHPVIYNEKIYITDGDRVWVLEKDTGKELWQMSAKSDTNYYPVFSSEALFLIKDKNVIQSYNSKTGTLIWEKMVRGKIALTPTIKDDYIIVCVQGLTSHLIALEKETGRILWDKALENGSFNPDIYPILLSDLIIVLMNNNRRDTEREEIMAAYNIDTGETVWSRDWARKDSSVMLQPAITEKGILMYSEEDNAVWNIDINTGDTIIAKPSFKEFQEKILYLYPYKQSLLYIKEKGQEILLGSIE